MDDDDDYDDGDFGQKGLPGGRMIFMGSFVSRKALHEDE